MHTLFQSLLRVAPIRWQRVLEYSRLLRSLLNKVILIATDGLTKELCIGAYLFARTVMRMARRWGMLHCAFYLKQCASSLQRIQHIEIKEFVDLSHQTDQRHRAWDTQAGELI